MPTIGSGGSVGTRPELVGGVVGGGGFQQPNPEQGINFGGGIVKYRGKDGNWYNSPQERDRANEQLERSQQQLKQEALAGGPGSSYASSASGFGLPGGSGTSTRRPGGGPGGINAVVTPPTPQVPGTPVYSAQGGIGGHTSLSQPAFETQQQIILQSQLAQRAAENLARQQAGLANQAFQGRLNAIQGAGFGDPGPGVSHGTSIRGNEEEARAAAFARAREQAGNISNMALQSLQGLHEGQGTMGSTMEARQQGRILGGAESGLSNVNTQQMLADLDRAAEVADLEYQGGITQRGQNVALQQALLSLMNSGPLY